MYELCFILSRSVTLYLDSSD